MKGSDSWEQIFKSDNKKKILNVDRKNRHVINGETKIRMITGFLLKKK